MSKKAEKSADIQKLLDQMKTMQDELDRLKTITINSQPEPKFKYGVRILKLEDGRTHIEVFGPPGQQVTVTLEDLAGLARVLDERIRFWYQQQFASEASALAQRMAQQTQPEKAQEGEASEQEAQAG